MLECAVMERVAYAGASIPLKPMMHIEFLPYLKKLINFPPIFVKFVNFPLFSLNLRVICQFMFFCFRLFLPWCIYASCFTRTGRPWAYVILSECNLSVCVIPIILSNKWSILALDNELQSCGIVSFCNTPSYRDENLKCFNPTIPVSCYMRRVGKGIFSENLKTAFL